MTPKSSVPSRRYARDVAGMPCFAATAPLTVYIGPEHIEAAVPKDDMRCAVALACRDLMRTPYASVGRRRTDIALPHPQGVRQPGYGSATFAVIRYGNTDEVLEVVVAADVSDEHPEQIEALADRGHLLVELQPPRPSDRPGRKRSGKANGKGRRLKGYGQDRLTLLGVRNLNGQRRR
jgi:hypothetical protein